MRRLRQKKLLGNDKRSCSAGLSVSKSKLTISERDIERSILIWLNYQPKTKAWKNKSTGTYDPIKKCFRKSHDPFSQKGTSDIIGISNGKMVCIEVKSAKGRLTPEQQAFLSEMTNLGAIAIVARSLTDVIQALPSGQQSLKIQLC